jgi:hypothetical protein
MILLTRKDQLFINFMDIDSAIGYLKNYTSSSLDSNFFVVIVINIRELILNIQKPIKK